MKIMILIVAVAVIAFFAIRFLRGHDGPSHAQGQSGDGQVIAQLRAAGSDLSRAHSVDFFLYFPSQDAADRVSSKLAVQGYSSSVKATEDGMQWLVLAKRELVPTEAALKQIRNEFTAIASAEDGEYDGWGAGVVR